MNYGTYWEILPVIPNGETYATCLRMPFPPLASLEDETTAQDILLAKQRMDWTYDELWQLNGSKPKELVEFFSKHWQGVVPSHFFAREVHEIQQCIWGLYAKMLDAVAYTLCTRYAKDLPAWWNPEEFPEFMAPVLIEHCTEHKDIWEPYFVSWQMTQGIKADQKERLLRLGTVDKTYAGYGVQYKET